MAKKIKAKPGPKHGYSLALADKICMRIANGESLVSVCRDEGMPSRATVNRWILEDIQGFASHYARARDLKMDLWEDEMTDIADDGRNDWMEREGRNGETFEIVNREAVERSKLRVDTRKWILTKLRPKRFGDKLGLEHDATESFRSIWSALATRGKAAANAEGS